MATSGVGTWLNFKFEKECVSRYTVTSVTLMLLSLSPLMEHVSWLYGNCKYSTDTQVHTHTTPPPFLCPPIFPLFICFIQTHWFSQTRTLVSNLETTSGPSMSCQPFLPVFLHRAEAEGLTSTPRSVDSPERCEEHDESLSMFCLDDLEPLCQQCAAVSHAGHRVYLLTEAATDCKVGLRCRALQIRHFKTSIYNWCNYLSPWEKYNFKAGRE